MGRVLQDGQSLEKSENLGTRTGRYKESLSRTYKIMTKTSYQLALKIAGMKRTHPRSCWNEDRRAILRTHARTQGIPDTETVDSRLITRRSGPM